MPRQARKKIEDSVSIFAELLKGDKGTTEPSPCLLWVGGGVELSFDVDRFIEIWESE